MKGFKHCGLFECIKAQGSDKCCYFCNKKTDCRDPCDNDPKQCGYLLPPDYLKILGHMTAYHKEMREDSAYDI